MKFLLLFLFLIVSAFADVSHIINSDKTVPILKQVWDGGIDGNYQWQYETGNGIIAQEVGSRKNVGTEEEAQVVQGSAKWTASDGTPVEFSYTADENGYRPEGPFIPVAPPIPEAILRSIEYIKAHPPPVEEKKAPAGR